jgi:hypothetical protein
MHLAITEEGILTSSLGNEMRDLLKGRKERRLDVLIIRHFMYNETKFREYFRVACYFFQTILSAIIERASTPKLTSNHICRIAWRAEVDSAASVA